MNWFGPSGDCGCCEDGVILGCNCIKNGVSTPLALRVDIVGGGTDGGNPGMNPGAAPQDCWCSSGTCVDLSGTYIVECGTSEDVCHYSFCSTAPDPSVPGALTCYYLSSVSISFIRTASGYQIRVVFSSAVVSYSTTTPPTDGSCGGGNVVNGGQLGSPNSRTVVFNCFPTSCNNWSTFLISDTGDTSPDFCQFSSVSVGVSSV